MLDVGAVPQLQICSTARIAMMVPRSSWLAAPGTSAWPSGSRAGSSCTEGGVTHVDAMPTAAHWLQPASKLSCCRPRPSDRKHKMIHHRFTVVLDASSAPCLEYNMPPTWQDDLSHPWCKGESLQELRGSVSRNEPWVPHQTLQELNIVGHTLQLCACGHTYKEATHVSVRFLQDISTPR